MLSRSHKMWWTVEIPFTGRPLPDKRQEEAPPGGHEKCGALPWCYYREHGTASVCPNARSLSPPLLNGTSGTHRVGVHILDRQLIRYLTGLVKEESFNPGLDKCSVSIILKENTHPSNRVHPFCAEREGRGTLGICLPVAASRMRSWHRRDSGTGN
jgi:hypothetical protein